VFTLGVYVVLYRCFIALHSADCGDPVDNLDENDSQLYLIGGEGDAWVITFVGASKTYKKEHGRKETYRTKKSNEIKEVKD